MVNLETLQQSVFYPADVEAATGGYVNRRVQQTWKARNWFWTKIEEPLAGKPREYPLAAGSPRPALANVKAEFNISSFATYLLP